MSEIAERAPGIEDAYRRLDAVYNEAIMTPRPPDGPPPIHLMEAHVRLLKHQISSEQAAQVYLQEKIDSVKKTELHDMCNINGVPYRERDTEKELRLSLIRNAWTSRSDCEAGRHGSVITRQFQLQFNPDLELDSVEGFSGSSATHKRKAGEFVGTNAQWRAFTSEQRSAVIPPSKHAAATADQPNIVARGAAQIKLAGTCDRFIKLKTMY